MRPMSLTTTSSQTVNISDLSQARRQTSATFSYGSPPLNGRFRGNDREDVDQNLLILEAVVTDN